MPTRKLPWELSLHIEVIGPNPPKITSTQKDKFNVWFGPVIIYYDREFIVID
jgi:hypothetical protein